MKNNVKPQKASGYAAQQAIKTQHMKEIFLTALYEGSTTRAQLVKKLQLSAPAISALVEDLLGRGLLLESAKSESVSTGRPPVVLQLNPAALQLPVLAFRRDGLEYVLYDLQLRELEQGHLSYSEDILRYRADSADTRKPGVVPASAIYQWIQRELPPRTSKLDLSKVPALILSLPGGFDAQTKLFYSSHLQFNIDGAFLQELSAGFNNLPIFHGNDSDFFAYSEKSFLPPNPDSPRSNDLLFVNIQHGVGSGIIYQDRLFTCPDGDASEIGHITVDYNGLPCICGSRGCLERYLSFDALLDSARKDDFAPHSMDELALSYKQGNPWTEKVLDDAAHKLVFGLGNVLALFPIPRIVLGGGIEVLGPRFLECVRYHAARYSYRKVWEDVSICYAQALPHGQCLGGARLFLETAFPL